MHGKFGHTVSTDQEGISAVYTGLEYTGVQVCGTSETTQIPLPYKERQPAVSVVLWSNGHAGRYRCRLNVKYRYPLSCTCTIIMEYTSIEK